MRMNVITKKKDDVQNTKNMQRRFVLLEKYGGRK